MEEILRQAKEERAAVSVYTDREEMDRFSVGYVLGVSEEEVLMALISPLGHYDGYVLYKLDDIYRINECGLYESKIVGLYEGEAHKHAFFPIDESNLLGSLLAFSKQKGYIVRIELIDGNYEDVQGFYDDRTTNVISILCVSDYGERDGKTYLYVDDVSRITCDSQEEQVVKRLLMQE